MNYFQELQKSLINDDYDKFTLKLFNHISLINEVNEHGENLLHFASFYGLIDKYYALINLDCKLIPNLKRNTTLHYASTSGKDPFIILELIKAGILPTDTNIREETAIHYSNEEKITHYMRMWCYRNRIDIKDLIDIDGNTVLHSAFKYGNEDIVNYWLKQDLKLEHIKNKNGQLFYEVKSEKICLI